VSHVPRSDPPYDPPGGDHHRGHDGPHVHPGDLHDYSNDGPRSPDEGESGAGPRSEAGNANACDRHSAVESASDGDDHHRRDSGRPDDRRGGDCPRHHAIGRVLKKGLHESVVAKITYSLVESNTNRAATKVTAIKIPHRTICIFT
jgi:hypothetical protein